MPRSRAGNRPSGSKTTEAAFVVGLCAAALGAASLAIAGSGPWGIALTTLGSLATLPAIHEACCYSSRSRVQPAARGRVENHPADDDSVEYGIEDERDDARVDILPEPPGQRHPPVIVYAANGAALDIVPTARQPR